MLKIFTALTLLFSVSSGAALTVVADLGGESVEGLFAALGSASDVIPPPPASSVPLTQAVFPVVSTRLHPGEVTAQKRNLPGMTPLFLLGDDPRSLRWLQANQQRLLSLHATGLVVSVASVARFQALQSQAGALTLLPVSGDDLAQRLHLTAYPVLLTDHGLSP